MRKIKAATHGLVSCYLLYLVHFATIHFYVKTFVNRFTFY